MSNNQKEKRPNWYHPLARARYDGAMRTYGEIQARVLPKDIAEQWDVSIPDQWKEQPALYLLRGLGFDKGLPPGTGYGIVQSPYSDIYTKIYGVNPLSDLPKYRKMYRSHPDIQQAIQMQVNLAVGKGFTIAHDDEDVIEYLIKAVNRLDLPQHMLTMGTDMLTYGNSFTEIQWDKSVQKKEQIYDYQGTEYTAKDLKSLDIPMSKVKPALFGDSADKKNFIAQSLEKDPDAKKIVALKDLDPLYMRVRRDSYGNIYGYIQWMAFPPILIDNESCIHIKYRPMSWGYESFTSNTLVKTNPSIQKISDLLINDKVLTKNGKYVALQEPPNAHPYKGKIYKITGKYTNIPIECTWQHPILTYENKEFKYKFAKDFKIGDKLIVPINTSYKNIDYLNLRDYINLKTLIKSGYTKERDELLHKKYNESKCYKRVSEYLSQKGFPTNSETISRIINGKTNPSNKSLKVAFDKKLFRLAGYYLSEGYMSGKGSKHTHFTEVHFDFGLRERKFAEEVAQLGFEIFGSKLKIKEVKNRFHVTIQSSPCAILFEYFFKRGAHNKRIHEIFMFAKPELQKELFETWINGDGYIRKRCSTGTTVSQELAYQMHQICLRQMKPAGIYKRINKHQHRLKDGRLINSNPIQYHISTRDGKCSKLIDNKLIIPIVKINTYEYDGLVWDIHVPDDESFCTEFGYAVSNSAYGTSILMPIIKNTDLLNQFENDAAVWIHSRAVPPLIVKGGTEEKPYSTSQMTALMDALKTRTAATMIFTKGDVSFDELKTMASDLNLDWWLKYLLLRRYQSLGVPPIFMGLTERGSKGTAEVLLHDFVTRLQVLQEFISDPIEEYIFKPLIKAKFGEDVENAEIVWKPIIEEDKNMRSQRLIQMLQAGAATVNEVREEMGFGRMSEDKYDKLQPPQEPAAFGKGVPPKPGAASPKAPELNRITEQNKKPPEGHMKLEDLKSKKIQLLQLDEAFREKMLNLTRKTKFDLKDDGKLVKEVKNEAQSEAQNIINEHVVASYLVGRLNANGALGKEDDLTLKQEDLESLANLKETCTNDFDKILEDMVKMKEEGKLE